MKRYTMLEMVQEIARSLNADEVTTLTESVESVDITNIAVSVLESLSTRREWYWRQHKVRQMTAGTGGQKTTLVLPLDVDTIEEVQYRSDIFGSNQATFVPLQFLSHDDFLVQVRSRDLAATNVDTLPLGDDSVDIFVYNDRPPKYFTQFDEGAIVCDAYDIAVDPTGLSAARSMLVATVNIDTATARTTPSWVAPIPTRFFPLWLAQATATASLKLRQMQDADAERDARRLLIDLTEFNEQVKSDRTNKEVNHGRRYGY
jgi:hypothetical protein